MAGVAVDAVVYVTAHTLVLIVGVRLSVTVRALKDAVVVRIRMTRGADSVGAAVLRVEPGVIEGRSQPAARRVSGCARSGEASRQMIRVRGRGVVGLVATVAIGRQSRVIAVHMTIGACYAGMSARQRKTCVVVIEGCRNPRRGVVADVALLRKAA